MNLLSILELNAKKSDKSVLSPVLLDDTPSPAIKGPAREPRNWWRLGDVSIAKALRESPLKNPVNPQDWTKRGIAAGGPGSGCRGDNCGRPKNPGGQLSWDRKVVEREGLIKERKT